MHKYIWNTSSLISLRYLNHTQVNSNSFCKHFQATLSFTSTPAVLSQSSPMRVNKLFPSHPLSYFSILLGSVLRMLIALITCVFSIKTHGCSHRHRIILHKTPPTLLPFHDGQVFSGSFWPLETRNVRNCIRFKRRWMWNHQRETVLCNSPGTKRATKSSTTSTSASRGKEVNFILLTTERNALLQLCNNPPCNSPYLTSLIFIPKTLSSQMYSVCRLQECSHSSQERWRHGIFESPLHFGLPKDIPLLIQCPGETLCEARS